MLGAIEFNFPIRRPNNRFTGNSTRVAAVRTLLTAHRTRLVRVSVDVNYVRHRPDYTADAGNRVPPSAEALRDALLIYGIEIQTIRYPSCYI